jgi:putative ABC transport system ATP-binding protein
MAVTPPIIHVSQLRKVYVTGSVETVALDTVSFDIQKGEFVAIMGPSGSGKSTLMHVLGALDKPTSGKYLLDGQDVGSLSKDQLEDIRNQKIGFVFQAFNLLPRISAMKNVMLPLAYAGIPKAERIATAEKYLRMVGLGDRLEHTSNQLSGGQQQRVAIARALVLSPALILADEPTGNIASSQADEVMEIFEDLHKQGHTIVMITHEPDVAVHAERIIHVKDGKIVEDGRNTNRRKIKSN